MLALPHRNRSRALRRPPPRRLRRLAGLLLAGLAVAPGARAAELAGSCEIRFVGSSTLHDFEGQAPPVSFRVSGEGEEAGPWRATVEVPVAALDTGIARRDAHMREMFDAEHFPAIRGTFADVDPEAVRRSGRLPFALTIRDVTREVEATVTNWTRAGERLEFDAVFPVSLEAFGLEAPRILFVRVGDTVRVRAHVTMRRR